MPLAIEALTSAFMASALFGPYLFGWERFSKGQHLLIIWIIAIAIKFSAVWLVVAESWLQNPVGSEFNFQSLRMELTDFSLVVTNPLVFNKIYHTLAAGYAVGAASILAVCSWLLLKNPADQAARKSYQLSAILGVLAILIICSGDNTLKSGNPVQIRKFAAVNALDSSNMLTGIELQISNGIKAYELLQELRDEKNDPQLLSDFNGLKADLGYALLLERWTNHITDANYTQIELAKKFTLPPHHALLFLFNRLMIVVGIINLLLFGLAVWQGFSKTPPQSWLLKLNMQLLLLPWLAFVGGWFIAIVGIQPWAMAEILPVFLSLSTLSVKELLISLPVYLICYAGLLLLALYLILHIINSQVSIRDTGVKT